MCAEPLSTATHAPSRMIRRNVPLKADLVVHPRRLLRVFAKSTTDVAVAPARVAFELEPGRRRCWSRWRRVVGDLGVLVTDAGENASVMGSPNFQ